MSENSLAPEVSVGTTLETPATIDDVLDGLVRSDSCRRAGMALELATGWSLHRAHFFTARAAITMTLASYDVMKSAIRQKLLVTFDRLLGASKRQGYKRVKKTVENLMQEVDCEEYAEEFDSTTKSINDYGASWSHNTLSGYFQERVSMVETHFDTLRELIRSHIHNNNRSAFDLGESLAALHYPITMKHCALELCEIPMDAKGLIPWDPSDICRAVAAWRGCQLADPCSNIYSLFDTSNSDPQARVDLIRTLICTAIDGLKQAVSPKDLRKSEAEGWIQIVDEKTRRISILGQEYVIDHPDQFTILEALAKSPNRRLCTADLKKKLGIEGGSRLSKIRKDIEDQYPVIISGKPGRNAFYQLEAKISKS